jgi:hypothetical protein
MQIVDDPHVSEQQAAVGVNDSGQIVGIYLDSSGEYHGYGSAGLSAEWRGLHNH